uniref:Uncharacterized protein n=1 Tax=Clandestinovirus TaxID=2831644 RepID=A0A8F8PK50_9VIRU|nr:hypothetical protein KOM_12_385 [Clandestinovirus]
MWKVGDSVFSRQDVISIMNDFRPTFDRFVFSLPDETYHAAQDGNSVEERQVRLIELFIKSHPEYSVPPLLVYAVEQYRAAQKEEQKIVEIQNDIIAHVKQKMEGCVDESKLFCEYVYQSRKYGVKPLTKRMFIIRYKE